MRIIASARKHGIADADILHALRNYLRVYEPVEGVAIFVGAARDGTILEIGVVDDDDPRIIHAMKARTGFWPGWGKA